MFPQEVVHQTFGLRDGIGFRDLRSADDLTILGELAVLDRDVPDGFPVAEIAPTISGADRGAAFVDCESEARFAFESP